MKKKNLLLGSGLSLMIIILSTLISNAQINFQGLAVDHEGIAVWDADGSGPEPYGEAHAGPFGWGGVCYYCASRDYDEIDPDPNAACCHFLDNITGFPLFVEALTTNGYTAGQLKIKMTLFDVGADIEGEDWFTFNNMHYFNRYDGFYQIELDGELMVSGHLHNMFIYIDSTSDAWQCKTSYSRPVDDSKSSSAAVQAVAEAFILDMNGEELRLVFDEITSTGIYFYENGRDGLFMEIVAGHIEKGMPELPYTGPADEHQGYAGWDADGSGPEPEAYGHTYWYNGVEYWMSYYIASRDYDGIDMDPNAALGHFVEGGSGFSNLEIQMAYRGYTMDQLKIKSGYGIAGDDVEGIDWGLDSNIHWYNHYGYECIIEIDAEPILRCIIDTSFSFDNMDNLDENWWAYTNDAVIEDISADASTEAQYVAASFLKDIANHPISIYCDGNIAPGVISGNGREGRFHNLDIGKILPKLPHGTLIYGGAVSGVWTLDKSPYIIMGYIYVPDGLTLEIKPGVVVKFNTKEDFDIEGRLLAEGQNDLPILFTAYDESVRWGGMDWDETPASNDTSFLKHCILEYAYAYGSDSGYNSGAALAVNDFEKLEISHCTFRYNLADKPGPVNPAAGAMVIYESSIHVHHCIFHDNQAGHGGALCISSNSNPIFDNCLFYNNEAINYCGGVILTYISASPVFINCTFADNYAVDAGGVAELEHGGSTSFINCIFWGNSSANGPNQFNMMVEGDTCGLNIYYSDVEEGIAGIDPEIQLVYMDNIEEEPLFIAHGDYPFALEDGSPCINEGTLEPGLLPAGWLCPSTCLCGNTRVYGSGIDMGCYEWAFEGVDDADEYSSSIIDIYPNPATGTTCLRYLIHDSGYLISDLYTVSGKKIRELINQEIPAGEHEIVIDVSDLPEGVYFVRMQVGRDIAVSKLLVVH